MRIFSFVPAFLLVTIGYVAAAAVTPTTPTVTSCSVGSGNQAAFQCMTDIINNATAYIGPLSKQLGCMFITSEFSPPAALITI